EHRAFLGSTGEASRGRSDRCRMVAWVGGFYERIFIDTATTALQTSDIIRRMSDLQNSALVSEVERSSDFFEALTQSGIDLPPDVIRALLIATASYWSSGALNELTAAKEKIINAIANAIAVDPAMARFFKA
ncbi:MAG: hypothetical protein Q8L56_00085, partial [Rhodocyclaceae bacterium]|nr:hypothetical protein [Rhodocyclaceae bacterium]